MIETEYVNVISCDVCTNYERFESNSTEELELKLHNSDWSILRFRNRNAVHLCPDCAEQFMNWLENENNEDEEEPDNLDADGNEQRCGKCFYYEPMRIDNNFGHCKKDDRYVYDHMHCGAFSGM